MHKFAGPVREFMPKNVARHPLTRSSQAQRGEDRPTHAHAASPRPLARTTRNENEDETKPISRFGVLPQGRTRYP